ncbi:hypothetical protein B0H17DRAFT_1198140 [Mycena rosella]|uniref:Uncharacterized protein n=1 Tax=Mycena rosella TaxID=1033263 RepID=A0AAD7DPL1_MYCRO|nr:hypothetical protein B0H17DRAFT_1198140 [Mycena rosella]
MGHVNMMTDTVIVNASPEDLRAILRSMLASKTPGLASAFLMSTRARVYQRSGAGDGILYPFSESGAVAPRVLESLTRARLLYGSGLGFASLAPLAAIVRSTIGHRWPAEGEEAYTLVVIDADIAQALQSCKDELLGSPQSDYSAARKVLGELVAALEASRLDVDKWGGEFPFERGMCSVLDFKL